MYFIKKITIDEDKKYQNSLIIDHTNKSFINALQLLDSIAKTFVKEESGREAGENAKIIEIHDFEQVNNPNIDCILLYKLINDPHKIYVYQKKTSVTDVAGWFYGTSQIIIPNFRMTHIYELEEYDKKINLFNSILVPEMEYVPIGPAGIKVPKNLTISPAVDLINELKNSEKFKACRQKN